MQGGLLEARGMESAALFLICPVGGDVRAVGGGMNLSSSLAKRLCLPPFVP